MGNSTTFFQCLARSTVSLLLPSWHPREFQVTFFSNHSALRANPYGHTYKDQFPMVLEQPPTLFFQETYSVHSIPMSRTSYNESSKGGSWRSEKPWMQENCTTWMSTCPLRTWELKRINFKRLYLWWKVCSSKLQLGKIWLSISPCGTMVQREQCLCNDGNFGHHQEAWTFLSLWRSPDALRGQERSGEAGKG